jgi:hypothetical protein
LSNLISNNISGIEPIKMDELATDEDLKNALSDWLIDSLARIESNFKDLVLMITDFPQWYIAESGAFIRLPSLITYQVTQLEILIFDKNVTWKLLETTAARHPRFAKHLNSPIASGSIIRRYSVKDLCEKLLPQPVPVEQTITINTKIDVKLAVGNFIKDLNDDYLKVTTIWPVSGVRTELPIQLNASTELRELTAAEKRHCLNLNMIQIMWSNTIDADSAQWYGLCHTEEEFKFTQPAYEQIDDFQQKFDSKSALFEDFMSVIQLYVKPNLRHCGGTSNAASMEVGGLFASGVVGHGAGSQSIHFTITSHNPMISESDAQSLIDIWKLLHGQHISKYQKRVANAARRVYYSDTRMHPEDMIVDCMIAAESLYLDEEKNELSFRLSVNAAMWASDHNLERKRIFELFKNAYNLRSKVVHGGSVNVSEVRSIIEPLKKSLREGILKALVHIRKHGGNPDWNSMLFPENILQTVAASDPPTSLN